MASRYRSVGDRTERQIKVLFFVTIQEVIPLVEAEAGKAGLDVTVRLWTKESDIPSFSYIEDHYDAVVCRGYMYQRLKAQMLTIPVICCPSTVSELLASVYEARSKMGNPRPKIYRVGALDIALDEGLISEITATDFHYLKVDLDCKPAVLDAVRQAEVQGADGLLCGPTAEGLIRESGAGGNILSQVLVNQFSAESIALGLQMVHYSIASAETARQKGRVLENIIQYSFDAVILLDEALRIRLFNTAAEEMFGIKLQDSFGRSFFDVFPQFYPHFEFEKITEERELFGKKILVEDGEYISNSICVPALTRQDGTVQHQYILYLRKLETMEHLQNSAFENMERFANESRYVFRDIIGESAKMKAAIFKAKRFAEYDATVMLMGESGTGKELFAQSIHNASSRRRNRFVALNCAAVPVSLLESELFGYARGAFTGALKEGKKGLFEIAERGTLFLDEITEMDLAGQQKLLRVLAEQKVRRVGDDVSRPIDVRVIAATNKDIVEQIQKGRFLEDLFYRLNVLSLRIPPLRERKGDISLLTDHYIGRFRSRFQRNISLEPEAYEELEQVPWYGNVRQLRNFCERLVIVADQRSISGSMVREQLEEDCCYMWKREDSGTDRQGGAYMPVEKAKRINGKAAEERKQILAALNENQGSREKAAAQLGISPSTLYRKMKKYQIASQMK